MDTYTEATFPRDSLGRRIGIAEGFSEYTDNMLAQLKADLSLSMSVSDLKFCKEYYSKAKIKDAFISQLYLFDAITAQTKTLSSNADITDLFVESKAIIDTYNDIYAKHSAMHNGSNTPPLTLASAARLWENYVCDIGASEKLCDILPQKTLLHAGIALIIFSAPECDEKKRSLDLFLSSPEISARALAIKRVDSRGVAVAVADIASGAYLNMLSIPAMPAQTELSHLATECHGATIVAVNEGELAVIQELMSQYSLKGSYFAKTTDSPVISIIKNGNISSTLDCELLRSICSARYPAIAVIRGETEKYYADAIENVVLAVAQLVEKGVDLKEMHVKLSFGFPSLSSEKAIGASLSAILGAYRALCELGVDAKTDISFNDSDELLFDATALTSRTDAFVGELFCDAGHEVYLLSFDRDTDGHPDLNSFREMCRHIQYLKRMHILCSLKIVSDDIEKTLSELKEDYPLQRSYASVSALPKVKLGFVAETSMPSKFGVFLGTVGEKSPKNDTDEQEFSEN